MKSPIIATILLVLAAPAFASPRSVTAAQEKDMHRLYRAAFMCREYSPRDDIEPGSSPTPDGAIPWKENRRYKKACELSDKLQGKLTKQGFCITSLHRPVGRPNKKTGQCDAVRIH